MITIATGDNNLTVVFVEGQRIRRPFLRYKHCFHWHIHTRVFSKFGLFINTSTA